MNQKSTGTSTFDVWVKKISTGEPARDRRGQERGDAVAVERERQPPREEHEADAHRDRERARDRDEDGHVAPRVGEAARPDAREAAEIELTAQRHDREPRQVERQVEPPVEVRVLVVAEEPVVDHAQRLLGRDVVAVPGVEVREPPPDADQHERERRQHDHRERAPLEPRGSQRVGGARSSRGVGGALIPGA